MSRKYKICVALADIHIGVKHITAQNIKEQLKKNFFNVVEKFPVLDGIFILGDTLHSPISLNSDYSSVYMWFANKIYKLARKKGATVVWILGTRAHDGQQLDNIKGFVDNDDNVDFRIYETVEEITLWDDYKVLILPDVKFKQLEDVDKLFDEPNKYDMILGHGLIDQMQYFMQESENMPTKTYVYDVQKLMNASKGPVLFGHIHKHMRIRNKFYYAGPFTLLERGTQTTTGFLVVGIYDKDRTKYKVEQYVNPDSVKYYEIVVSKEIMDQYPIDDIVAGIDEIVSEAQVNDLITLRITRGDETESADKVLILENRYRRDRRISIVKKIKSKKEEENERIQQDKKNKYEYLMDQNQPMSSILYNYYLSDVQPTLPQKQHTISISLEDFQRALGETEV